MLALSIAQIDLHDPYGFEHLPSLFGGEVHSRRFQFLFQGPVQQKRQKRNEDVRLHTMFGLVIDGSHFDDILESGKSPLDFAEILVDFHRFDRREILLLALNEVFAFQGFFL